MSAYPPRYSRCDWPWSAVRQSDLEPQGKPEIRTELRRETLLGLLVKGSDGNSMGLLGLRCEAGTLLPLSAALSDDAPSAQADGDPGGD